MIDSVYAWGKPFWDFLLYLDWQTNHWCWAGPAMLAVLSILAWAKTRR